MTRVFLPEPSTRYDFSAAEVFGTLECLLRKPLSPFDPNSPLMIDAALEMVHFDAESDLLCLAGKNVTIAMVLAVANQKLGPIRCLVFDARSSSYREILFDARIKS